MYLRVHRSSSKLLKFGLRIRFHIYPYIGCCSFYRVHIYITAKCDPKSLPSLWVRKALPEMSLHIFRALSKQELSGTDCCLFHHTEDKTKTSLIRGPKCAASPDALLMQHWEPLVRETATDPTLFRVEYISMEYQKPYVQCASSFYVWGFETTNLSRVHRFRCCMNCRANAGNLLLDFRTTFEKFDTAVPAKPDQKGQWISIYSVLLHAYNNVALLFDSC